MRLVFCYLSIFILFISCSKKDGDNDSVSQNLITGTYKGGTLTWIKTTYDLEQTQGTDPSVQFEVSKQEQDKITLIVKTNSAIPTTKTYILPLIYKTENDLVKDYQYKLESVSADIKITTSVEIEVQGTRSTLIFVHMWEALSPTATFSHLEYADGAGYR